MNNVIVLLLLISFFCLRPCIFGQQYTTISLIIQSIIVLLFLFKNKNIKLNISRGYRNKVYYLYILFWVYCLLQAYLLKSSGIDYVFKAFLASVVTFTTFYIVFLDKEIRFKFFKWQFMILRIGIISWIITLLLSNFIEYSNLFLYQLNISGYGASGKIYFPFTVLYGFMTVGSLKLPRLLLLFRESGITQMILIWYLFNLKAYQLDSKLNKILLIIGIIATFSTAGIFLLILVISFRYVAEKINFKRIAGFILIFIISIYTLYYMPYIGLANKMITHSTSISDRAIMMKRGFFKFLENPFGQGLYSDLNVANSSINFIAGMYTIGIVGIFLFILIFVIPLFKRNNYFNRNYFICILPIFLTILFFQPLIDAPAVYIFLLADYGLKNTNKLL